MRLTGVPRRLVAALAARAGADPVVEEVRTRPWASATFSGARHCLKLHIAGSDSDFAADRLAEGLEEAEFDLGTDLVVDIAMIDRHRDAGGTALTIEALTVEAD